VRSGDASPDGRWLAQGMDSGDVIIWGLDPQTGSISQRQTISVNKPTRVPLPDLGLRVAVSEWAGDVLVFDVANGREVTHRKLVRTPTPLALSPDGRFVEAYANEGGLTLFDLQADERRDLWPGAGARVNCLSFSGDGRVLLAGLDDGTARAWLVADGRSLLVLETGHRRVNKVTATADLSLLATVGDGDCVKVWDCRLP